MALRFNAEFSNIVIEQFDRQLLEREELEDVLDKGYERDSYVTLDDLQEKFSMSRNSIANLLKKIEIKPFGKLKNMKDGKRTRGVAKIVFSTDVIDEIDEYLRNSEDESNSMSIDDIKRMAMNQLDN